MKRFKSGAGVVGGILLVGGVACAVAGELTVEGNLVVQTNLVVKGQLSGQTLALTNLAISGGAVIQRATIQHLVPQGDLGMGPYTNGVAH